VADEDEQIIEIKVFEEQVDLKSQPETPKVVKRTLHLRSSQRF
jgi:hypothetical protein